MRIVIPALTRLFSALVALALMALGGLILIEAIANWTGNGFLILPTNWPTQLRSTAWDDTIVRNSLLAMLAIGLALLLVAFWRRPPLTVDSSHDGVRIERHALETSLRRRLDSLDGVSSARVRVDKTRIRASVDTTRHLTPEAVRDRAVEELTGFCTLHDLDLTPDVTLHTTGASR